MLPVLDSAELPADAIEVGRIADAWGVKGWFKVFPHSAHPEALFSSRRWFIQTAAGNCQRLPVSEAREHGNCVVASSLSVPDRGAAEALRGARIFVPRSSFPSVGADEYYWVDLIGLDVVNREGHVLGTVRDLMANGPQTTLVLAAGPDDKPVERLIPFVSAFIDNVDLPSGRITVDWQADY